MLVLNRNYTNLINTLPIYGNIFASQLWNCWLLTFWGVAPWRSCEWSAKAAPRSRRSHIPLKRRFSWDLYVVTSQKTTSFIATAMKTENPTVIISVWNITAVWARPIGFHTALFGTSVMTFLPHVDVRLPDCTTLQPWNLAVTMVVARTSDPFYCITQEKGVPCGPACEHADCDAVQSSRWIIRSQRNTLTIRLYRQTKRKIVAFPGERGRTMSRVRRNRTTIRTKGRVYVPPKCWYPLTRLHDVTIQKRTLRIIIAMKRQNKQKENSVAF
jgi:hypothetical protein